MQNRYLVTRAKGKAYVFIFDYEKYMVNIQNLMELCEKTHNTKVTERGGAGGREKRYLIQAEVPFSAFSVCWTKIACTDI